jgi:hypothetical protein
LKWGHSRFSEVRISDIPVIINFSIVPSGFRAIKLPPLEIISAIVAVTDKAVLTAEALLLE